MTLLLFNVLPVLVTLVLTIVVSKRWNAGSRRNNILLGLGAALGIHVVFTLIGALLAAPFYRWLEPTDDWWDIVAGTTVLLNIAGTPIMLILGALIGYRQHRLNTRNAVCRQCGYDLRGSPSGRCPECGHANEPTTADARIALAHHPANPEQAYAE